MSREGSIRELMIDTSAFFAKGSRLASLIEDGVSKLTTIDLVVFEFTKLLQAEIREATARRKKDRVETLTAVLSRFPDLLKTLGIEIKSPEFTVEDLSKLYAEIERGQDAGDYMIWLKMQKVGINTIITQDTAHWKKLGASVIAV